MRNPGLSPHTPHYILAPIRRTWVAASLHAGTQCAGHYWPRKIPGATHTQEWPGKAGWIWASWPTWLRAARSSPGSCRSSPRAPRSGQEDLLVGFGHPVPWQAHRVILAVGLGGGQPGTAQEAPGATPRAPMSCQDELLAAFGPPGQHG